jgi:hypothetical protein
LVARARGKVWIISNRDGGHLATGLVIVSTRQVSEELQYRVLSDAAPGRQARVVDPTLEDGYIWLMHCVRERKTRC